MKKKILFGVIIAASLILIVPSISAVEYQTVLETSKAKLQGNNFIDIAAILTVINIIIARMVSGFQGNIRGVIYTAEVALSILAYIKLIKDAYDSGMSVPRYKAYQAYFQSLFAIISIIFVKSLPDTVPKIKVMITQVLFFVILFLSKYLGNMLYVALGRPS